LRGRDGSIPSVGKLPAEGMAIGGGDQFCHHSPMLKFVPLAIGLRYLRAKRRNGFISFISLASILGIALGVAALITTLAVMTGFQREIRDRMLEMAAHATVTADGAAMENWQHAVAIARQDPRVAGAAPYIETEALLQ